MFRIFMNTNLPDISMFLQISNKYSIGLLIHSVIEYHLPALGMAHNLLSPSLRGVGWLERRGYAPNVASLLRLLIYNRPVKACSAAC